MNYTHFLYYVKLRSRHAPLIADGCQTPQFDCADEAADELDEVADEELETAALPPPRWRPRSISVTVRLVILLTILPALLSILISIFFCFFAVTAPRMQFLLACPARPAHCCPGAAVSIANDVTAIVIASADAARIAMNFFIWDKGNKK